MVESYFAWKEHVADLVEQQYGVERHIVAEMPVSMLEQKYFREGAKAEEVAEFIARQQQVR